MAALLSLKDIDLRNQYRSDRHDLLQDFYIPCLSRAVTYDRAVGFFSSTSLALAARGLSHFIQSNGQMRLIASPHKPILVLSVIELIAQKTIQQNQIYLTPELTAVFTWINHNLCKGARLCALTVCLTHPEMAVFRPF